MKICYGNSDADFNMICSLEAAQAAVLFFLPRYPSPRNRRGEHPPTAFNWGRRRANDPKRQRKGNAPTDPIRNLHDGNSARGQSIVNRVNGKPHQ